MVGDTVDGALVDFELLQAEITSATAPTAANAFSRPTPRIESLPLTDTTSPEAFVQKCSPPAHSHQRCSIKRLIEHATTVTR